MGTLSSSWITVRSATISGFSADPDWIATNDVAAARATGEHGSIFRRGALNLSLVLRNAEGNIVASDVNTTATIDVLTTVDVNDFPTRLTPDQTIIVNGEAIAENVSSVQAFGPRLFRLSAFSTPESATTFELQAATY